METKELDNEYVAHSYGRFNTALSKGKGSTVYDESGKEYIDFGSGIGVTAFGLCDNEWKAAVEMQLDKMQHVSNLYYTEPCAKLAKMLKKQGRNPLLAACDVYRPAAIDQLKIVGEKAGVPVFEMGKANPVKIAKEAIKRAKDYGNDVVILDTAGRLHIDEALMDELKNIKKEVEPNEILLVIDSMTGQDAVNVTLRVLFSQSLTVTLEAVRRFR